MKTKKEITMFGLRVKGKDELLQLSSFSNDGADACGDRTYTLNENGDEPFFVGSFNEALRAITESTPWYNSAPETPEWGEDVARLIKEDKIEIVKVHQVIEEEVEPVEFVKPVQLRGINECLNDLDYNNGLFKMTVRKAPFETLLLKTGQPIALGKRLGKYIEVIADAKAQPGEIVIKVELDRY